MTTPALVLASASPRRSELLQRVGLTFEVRPADIDERPLEGEAPAAMVERVSLAKARAVGLSLQGPHLILAADTIVVRDGTILGKPATAEEAITTVTSLAGRAHEVITGYALLREDGRHVAGHCTTTVRFRPLTPGTIARYVATGEPMDKAGAYGIQGIGAMLVQSIEGSYTNVVGLPLVEVLERLPELGGPAL
ncbi:MAG: septum formation inhibitor Maf [Deltaproteobacteria bacterium]|nr:septum formation inhibitor Maf [Deltaproteobacteria bacterium]